MWFLMGRAAGRRRHHGREHGLSLGRHVAHLVVQRRLPVATLELLQPKHDLLPQALHRDVKRERWSVQLEAPVGTERLRVCIKEENLRPQLGVDDAERKIESSSERGRGSGRRRRGWGMSISSSARRRPTRAKPKQKKAKIGHIKKGLRKSKVPHSSQ